MKPYRRVISAPANVTFSEIYGENIELSNNNRRATRTKGISDCFVFGSSPIRTYQKVFLRHRQAQVDCIGSLRIGFAESELRKKLTHDTRNNAIIRQLKGEQQSNESIRNDD
jgi:hypothetical protein